MCEIKIFLAAIFVFAFSIFANAQQVPDYLFLEVLDSNQKPVAGAAVEAAPNGFSSNETQKLMTDEKGSVRFYLPWESKYGVLASFFTVIKDGFFTYHDLGGSSSRGESKAQIELLKIPQNKKEKRIVGDEQLKREFMWAAKTGDAETVKTLLKKGINPNLTTGDLRGVSAQRNIPAIQFAALSADAETVEVLIKAGVNIRTAEEPFRSLLLTYLRSDPFLRHPAKDENERREILRRYENGVDVLLKAGAEYNYVEENDVRSSIMIAAEKGYTRAVKLLLDKGFSVNSKNKYGETVLDYAARGDYEGKISKIETINFLLELGADPNKNCGAALRNAASRGDVAVIQALLKSGAKVNLPKCDNQLRWAVTGRKVAAARILIEAGANLIIPDNSAYAFEGNLLMIAAKNGDLEMVKLLIQKGFPVNAKAQDGSTALISAIRNYDNSKFETVKFLLESGANPNVVIENKIPDYCPVTLSFVSEYNLDLLKFLVANGADVNLACASGDTALVQAVRRYKPELVRQLIALGANAGGENIDRAMNLIKTYWKEDDYERKYVDETIKIIEEVRAALKNTQKSN